ncbi:HD domain-containing protein [Candidatus Kapabacteria bacterium]|nr:HD domain-containing protein [Candidatus Kapabacteria bacterium]
MEILFELEYEEKMPIGDSADEDFSLFIKSAKTRLADDFNDEMLSSAYWFCVNNHKDVLRKSGKPYYSHPLKVALLLINIFPICDNETIAASLMHDTIEDVEDVSYSKVKDSFGKVVADIVDGVTKISFENSSKSIGKAYTYKKIFTALAKDIRIILVKLADRLHNMRTLHYLKEHKQKEIALETLNFYTPIAHKLGLSRIKQELENLSFYFLDKQTYVAIRNALTDKRKEFLKYIQLFTDLIQQSLNEQFIDHTLSIVHKHEYEIYKIMQDGKSLSDIDNFYSIVIIINSNNITECYTAHGILAKAFTTINLLDYISNPKIDWNRSLNSELYGPDGKRVEIIIRTQEMEKVAEEGFFSVYTFEKGNARGLDLSDEDITNWEEWVEDIIKSRGEEAIQMIWNSVKVNLFDSAITVFTKDGISLVLPDEASILDYAFSLSEQDGISCIAGKVNGVTHDIGHKLKEGDQVEIITSPNSQPKPDWNRFVVTNKALLGLYKFFKENPGLDITNQRDSNIDDFKIRITGEDKEKMLQRITEAIGKNNMLHIQLDTTGTLFSGLITLKMQERKKLDLLFLELFKIEGMRSVENLKPDNI